jgi:hypothetical protein
MPAGGADLLMPEITLLGPVIALLSGHQRRDAHSGG